jgi:hypothetical protein
MCQDILHKLGYDATQKNKKILHDFHKRVLEYKSIAGMEQISLSKFLLEVGVYWAERGIFVRTKAIQPIGMEELPLSEIWDLL